jgi:hypothetical protein
MLILDKWQRSVLSHEPASGDEPGVLAFGIFRKYGMTESCPLDLNVS